MSSTVCKMLFHLGTELLPSVHILKKNILKKVTKKISFSATELQQCLKTKISFALSAFLMVFIAAVANQLLNFFNWHYRIENSICKIYL